MFSEEQPCRLDFCFKKCFAMRKEGKLTLLGSIYLCYGREGRRMFALRSLKEGEEEPSA